MISITFHPVINLIGFCICSSRNILCKTLSIRAVFQCSRNRFFKSSSFSIYQSLSGTSKGLCSTIKNKVVFTCWRSFKKIISQFYRCLVDCKRLTATDNIIATILIFDCNSRLLFSCSNINIIGIADSVFTAWDGCIIICYSNGRLFLCAIISKTACAQSKSSDLPWSDSNWSFKRAKRSTIVWGNTFHSIINRIVTCIFCFNFIGKSFSIRGICNFARSLFQGHIINQILICVIKFEPSFTYWCLAQTIFHM